MGGFRGGGMVLGQRAERSPRGRGASVGEADLPKRKPSLKKLWPQIRSLVAPRLGLLAGGYRLRIRILSCCRASLRWFLPR
jgi:hypothetical protein